MLLYQTISFYLKTVKTSTLSSSSSHASCCLYLKCKYDLSFYYDVSTSNERDWSKVRLKSSRLAFSKKKNQEFYPKKVSL